VLQISDPVCGFTDLACPEPAVLRVQWIPACAGMTITPVRARNLITASFAGMTNTIESDTRTFAARY
jgi:hypothetical protein